MRRDDVSDAGEDFIALLFSLLLFIWIQQASKAWRCMCACVYGMFVCECVWDCISVCGVYWGREGVGRLYLGGALIAGWGCNCNCWPGA